MPVIKTANMLRVVFKRPGRPPTLSFVGVELDCLQHAVGGSISTVSLGSYDLVANDNGFSERLPFNVVVLDEESAFPLVGVGFFVGVTGSDFRSLTDAEVADIMRRWRAENSVFMTHDDLTDEMQPPGGIAARYRDAVEAEIGPPELETA